MIALLVVLTVLAFSIWLMAGGSRTHTNYDTLVFLWVILVLAFWGGIIFVAVHFITKYW